MARLNTVNIVIVKMAAERVKRDGHVTPREYQALNAAFMALKKQTPVKVEQDIADMDPTKAPGISVWKCPRCHEDLGYYNVHKYCTHCGQALYWPDILGKICDKYEIENESKDLPEATALITACIDDIKELVEREEANSERTFKLPYDKGYVFGRLTGLSDALDIIKKLEDEV
jgi:hypothetical protein